MDLTRHPGVQGNQTQVSFPPHRAKSGLARGPGREPGAPGEHPVPHTKSEMWGTRFYLEIEVIYSHPSLVPNRSGKKKGSRRGLPFFLWDGLLLGRSLSGLRCGLLRNLFIKAIEDADGDGELILIIAAVIGEHVIRRDAQGP